MAWSSWFYMNPHLQTLIARQHRNVTRQQLLDLGLGSEAIKYRIRTGYLFPVYPGVYAVGSPARHPIETASAAVLACGPTAVLSHASALALWGLAKRWPATHEVTVTIDRRPKGITTHLSCTLSRADITRQHGIRVTTPARTVIDCAPSLTDRALARAVNDARLGNLLTQTQLAEALERKPCKRLAPSSGAPTRSQFEDAFLGFCAKHGLPTPQINVRIAGYEVDAYFAAEKVIVELDGYRYHSDRRTFERDRNRDAEMLARGIVTVRITWERLTVRPAAEAGRLHKILSARRPGGATETPAGRGPRRRARGRRAR